MPCQDNVSLNKLDSRLLDIPTAFLPLTEAETQKLQENIGVVNSKDEILCGLAKRIDAVIGRAFPGGGFIKMVSRSPKDSFIGHADGFRCLSGKHAVNLLCDSERIQEDTYQYTSEFSVLAIREWKDMSSQLEFRLFVKDRQLQGASQYFYRDNIAEISQNQDFYWLAIQDKFKDIKHLLPQDDVVIDFFYDGSKMSVIECNPYNICTDPCLFSWEAPIEGFRERQVPLPKVDFDKYINFINQKG